MSHTDANAEVHFPFRPEIQVNCKKEPVLCNEIEIRRGANRAQYAKPAAIFLMKSPQRVELNGARSV